MNPGGYPHNDTGRLNAWPYSLVLLSQEVRWHLAPIIAFMVLCAGIAAFACIYLPPSHRATAEILIDPRGLQVFENDLVSGQYDANSAINYVESQIHVILSAKVLAKALSHAQGETAASSPVSSREIDLLRRNISVTRAERSYILSVTARAADPQQAADLANAVVRAYLDEDAESRANVAYRLTEELGSRLDQLRRRLAESEERAEQYRRRNNLVGTDDKLIVDQQLSAAVIALDEAETRLAAARARHEQSLTMDPDVAVALAGGGDQSRLNALVERQAAAREEYARLSIELGSRHPRLRSARNRLDEVDRLMQAELVRTRTVSAASLKLAEEERDAAAQAVTRLSGQSADARESTIELRTLEEQIRSDRELLASFERRSREMAEFAQIDSANIRQLSMAYPPEAGRGLGRLIMWAATGAILGALLGFAFLVLRVMLQLLPPLSAEGMARAQTSRGKPETTARPGNSLLMAGRAGEQGSHRDRRP